MNGKSNRLAILMNDRRRRDDGLQRKFLRGQRRAEKRNQHDEPYVRRQECQTYVSWRLAHQIVRCLEIAELRLGPARVYRRRDERGRRRCLRITAAYDLASLAFRTFAQRSLCASAIRRRASLLKTRLTLLGFDPLT